MSKRNFVIISWLRVTEWGNIMTSCLQVAVWFLQHSYCQTSASWLGKNEDHKNVWNQSKQASQHVHFLVALPRLAERHIQLRTFHENKFKTHKRTPEVRKHELSRIWCRHISWSRSNKGEVWSRQSQQLHSTLDLPSFFILKCFIL